MKKDLSTPRVVQTKNTKESIYKAAEDIIKKRGYEYLSVKNICQVAGVSNGTFYYHYRTKEDLLSYYLSDGFSKFREDINFNVSHLPYDKQIIEYYKCYSSYVKNTGIEFISNYYTPNNKALNTRAYRNASMAGQHSWVINLTYTRLNDAEREGLLDPKYSAIDYANNCCTLLKGIIFDWALTDGAVNMEELIQELIGTYLNSIKA